jgi:hypothetical protein
MQSVHRADIEKSREENINEGQNTIKKAMMGKANESARPLMVAWAPLVVGLGLGLGGFDGVKGLVVGRLFVDAGSG